MTADGQEGTFWHNRSVLKLDCGEGCTTVYMYLKSMNC